MSKRRHGLVIVITGDGKGKTTSSLGLAFRALGNGFKIFMVQYIKGKWKTGEKKLADLLRSHADHLGLDIEIRPMGDGFTWITLASLEALGFCKKGEGGPFVEGGRIELGGALPVNTAGGLVSEAHASGVNHVIEAVRGTLQECRR